MMRACEKNLGTQNQALWYQLVPTGTQNQAQDCKTDKV